MEEHTQHIIEELLKKSCVPFDSIVVHEGDFGLVYMIETSEAPLLIGSGGANLLALNHLVKKMVEKQAEGKEVPLFAVDVNNYQKKRNEELKNKVYILRGRAVTLESNVEMEPMSPYERMVVHSLLATDDSVDTESVGHGRERRVVIKFKNTFSSNN